jgi:PAS domain S-box-containing protein
VGKKTTYEKMEKRLRVLEKDYHKHKQELLNLHEYYEKFKAIFDRNRYGIFVHDFEGNFLDANDTFLNLLGYRKEEIPNINFSNLIEEDQLPKASAAIEEIKQGGFLKNFIKLKLRCKDGRGVWVETDSSLVFHDGNPYAILGVARHITVPKKAEEFADDLVKANEQLNLEIEERKRAEKEASYEHGLMQTLLDNIPDYVYFKDKNRRFVRASNFFCDLFKCSLEDIIGKKDEDLFPEEIARETASDDRRVIKTGIPLINKEEGGESIGGEEHWVLTTKLPWRDRKGNIIGLFGISREITDRKRADEALRKIEERYVLATKAAGVGVWDWNVQTNEFYLDPNIKAILGYSDAEIPNDLEVWANYVHPDDKQPVMEAFQDHIDGKTSHFAYEHRMLHKDGSIRWIMARGTAIRDAQGNPVRVVGTDTDITVRKQAEEVLQEKDRKLECQAKNLEEVNIALKVLLDQRDKEKADFKENLLVNFKKLIFPYIEKLENRKLDEESQTYINIIRSNLRDIIAPIANTLSSKYIGLTPSEVQVANLINQGKTSKEIALMLNVSPKAVSFHRGNIRKKFGLLNKKINLKTYLQSFPERSS